MLSWETNKANPIKKKVQNLKDTVGIFFIGIRYWKHFIICVHRKMLTCKGEKSKQQGKLESDSDSNSIQERGNKNLEHTYKIGICQIEEE